MKLNFLRILGPKEPPATEAPPPAAEPLRGRGGHYLTSDPAKSDCPRNPELARVLAPHSIAEINDYVAAWEDREGRELTTEQCESVFTQAEAWLESKDQDYAEYVAGLLEDLAGQAPARDEDPEAAAEQGQPE